MYRSFARHYITDAERLPFSAVDYSRFKYGSGSVAATFGQELAEAFLHSHGEELLRHDASVLVPSPYDAIPTASFALANAFEQQVNEFLFSNGKKSLLRSKIHRYKTYTEDYGNMSAEQRLSLISSDAYHLDKDFLRGRFVLFMDDIKITGSHQLIIEQQLERAEVKGNFLFLYYAILADDTIAPTFENHLNYYAVRDVHGVLEAFNAEDFIMNTRIVKYILKSSAESFHIFIQHASRQRLAALVHYAIGNNYHLMPDYQHNLNQIATFIHYGNQPAERTAREPERA